MKKIIILIAIVLSILFIYLITKDNKIFYLNISDTENPYNIYLLNYIKEKNKLEKYINKFSNDDYRITSFINDIDSNKTVLINEKSQTLKNALVKADVITISIGNTDLYYKINNYDTNEMYNYVDELLLDYQELFKKIRKITKEKIIVFGYTIPSQDKKELIDYFNNKLNILCNDYKIDFIYIDNNTKELLIKHINSLLK